jgi:hypothetical protein
MAETATAQPAAPPSIEWRASSDEDDRHAFPPATRPGFPPPAVCGVRWTVRYGKAGAAWCAECVQGLRDQLAYATAALELVDAGDQRGDHYVRPRMYEGMD